MPEVAATCTLADDQDVWGRPDPGEALRACGEPAIAVLAFACIHEHIDHAAACAACAAEIQRVDDALICRHCESGPRPHQCPVVMKIRWLCDVSATPGRECPS